MRIESGREATLLKLIDLTKQRTGVINGNIANVNTPGYKRREVSFESAVADAIRRDKPIHEVEATVSTDTQTPERIDGNNVDLEKELALRDQNGVLYDAYLTLLESHYSLLDAAVRSGR